MIEPFRSNAIWTTTTVGQSIHGKSLHLVFGSIQRPFFASLRLPFRCQCRGFAFGISDLVHSIYLLDHDFGIIFP